MHLDEREQDIYNQLDPGSKSELDAIHRNTEWWQRLPKVGTIVLVAVIFAIAIL